MNRRTQVKYQRTSAAAQPVMDVSAEQIEEAAPALVPSNASIAQTLKDMIAKSKEDTLAFCAKSIGTYTLGTDRSDQNLAIVTFLYNEASQHHFGFNLVAEISDCLWNAKQ